MYLGTTGYISKSTLEQLNTDRVPHRKVTSNKPRYINMQYFRPNTILICVYNFVLTTRIRNYCSSLDLIISNVAHNIRDVVRIKCILYQQEVRKPGNVREPFLLFPQNQLLDQRPI